MFARWMPRRPVPELPHHLRAAMRRLDDELLALAAGTEPTEEALDACGRAFSDYIAYLTKHSATGDDRKFAEDDRADLYLNALKLTALQHPNHILWPLESDIRGRVLAGLKRRIRTNDSPWTRLGAIIPALLARDVKLALECYGAIRTDALLPDLAVCWVSESIMFPKINEVRASEAFLDALDLPPRPVWHAVDTLDPWRRWVLSTVIDPSYVSDPRLGISPALSRASCRILLREWWGIRDRGKAEEILHWLMYQGHRTPLAEELADLDFGDKVGTGRRFVARNHEALRKYGIAAWDLCRALDVARQCIRADYLGEDEAWPWMDKAARALRSIYPSWHALGDDFVLGFRYFESLGQGENLRIPYTSACLEWLKHSADSPWQRIPWQIDLA